MRVPSIVLSIALGVTALTAGPAFAAPGAHAGGGGSAPAAKGPTFGGNLEPEPPGGLDPQGTPKSPLQARTCELDTDAATPPGRPASKTDFDSTWITAVQGLWRDDAWAAGVHASLSAEGRSDRPRLWRFDGKQWQLMRPSFLDEGVEIRDLGASAPTDVWAVGLRAPVPELFILGDSVVAHWDGVTWTALGDDPSLAGASAVDAVAPNDVWVAGWAEDPARAVIEHWDGFTWTVTPLPTRTAQLQIFGIDAAAANDVWAVGSSLSTDATGTRSSARVLHWDGVAWRFVHMPPHSLGRVSSDLNAVVARAPNDVWVFGSRLDKTYASRALAFHWDGAAWTPTTLPAVITTPETADVAPDGSVWVAGINGVARWDGAAWAEVVRPGSQSGWASLSSDEVGRVWVAGSTQWGYSTVPLALRLCGA